MPAILSHSLSEQGITISFQKSGNLGSIQLNPIVACSILYHVGYIARYRFKKSKLHVTLHITEEIVNKAGILKTVSAGIMEVTWDYLCRHFELDEEWAKEIVISHESGKELATF